MYSAATSTPRPGFGPHYLEAVDLDEVLVLDNALSHQEGVHVLALVTLKLNHLAKLSVVNHCTITAELLLERLEDLLVFKAHVNSLTNSQQQMVEWVRYCPSHTAPYPYPGLYPCFNTLVSIMSCCWLSASLLWLSPPLHHTVFRTFHRDYATS